MSRQFAQKKKSIDNAAPACIVFVYKKKYLSIKLDLRHL